MRSVVAVLTALVAAASFAAAEGEPLLFMKTETGSNTVFVMISDDGSLTLLLDGQVLLPPALPGGPAASSGTPALP